MSVKTPAPQVRAFARSDAGRRLGNEDAFVVDSALGLAAVADGMGGQAGGAAASQMAMAVLRGAVATVPDAAFVLDPSLPNRQRLLDWLGRTVTAISASIHARAQQEPELRGMGTTLEVALVRGQSVFLAHVGDSRAYVLRGGALYLLTDDHTFERMLIARGTSTPEEAAAHPQRNVLSRALGVYPDEQADVAFYDLAPGDVFLLCTDGLHRVVPPETMKALLEADPAGAADALVHAALLGGARDNVTAAVLTIEHGAFTAPPIIGSETTRLALARSSLFVDFSVGELLRVQRIAGARVLRPGATLIEQGQVPGAVYLVLEGELSAWRDGERVGTISAGDPCGEYALVDIPSVTTLEAEVRTEVLEFPRAEILGLVKSDAAIAAKLAFATLARLSTRMTGLASSLARYRKKERIDPP